MIGDTWRVFLIRYIVDFPAYDEFFWGKYFYIYIYRIAFHTFKSSSNRPEIISGSHISSSKMAPNRGTTKASNKSGPKKDVKSSTSASKVSKVSKDKKGKRPPPKEMKNKSRSAPDMLKKKKKREYTEKELNLPSLNQITPVGVTKPRGKKKGKVFVDDQVRCALIMKIARLQANTRHRRA